MYIAELSATHQPARLIYVRPGGKLLIPIENIMLGIQYNVGTLKIYKVNVS